MSLVCEVGLVLLACLEDFFEHLWSALEARQFRVQAVDLLREVCGHSNLDPFGDPSSGDGVLCLVCLLLQIRHHDLQAGALLRFEVRH